MCHECHASHCPGCLPCCDVCGLETHAAYDTTERRRVCGDCRAAEVATETCVDCRDAVAALDARGLCGACGERHDQADRDCVRLLTAAMRAPRVKSERTLRREKRDREETAAYRAATTPDRLAALYAVATIGGGR